MSRLQTLTFVTESGGTQTLTIQDYEESEDLIFYEGSATDEAIDGSRRTNVRGTRKSFALSYKLSGDPDTFASILNNVITDLTSDLAFVYIGTDTNNLFRVTLDEDTIYKAEYANQHGLFIPKLSFKGWEINAQVNLEFLDYRFITEAVDIQEDWGLITEAVTEQRDYGTIV